jgi:hypothetical protein
VLQLSRHVALDVALLVVVADAAGGVPGTTQDAWHDEDWELQRIMQLVTVEVCAKRSGPAAKAVWAEAQTAAAATRLATLRMISSAARDTHRHP